MTIKQGQPPKSGWAAFKPELHVNNLSKSISFWCDIVGFKIAYERAAEKFAYLEYSNGAQLMLCQRHRGWETAEMEQPFGRGVMFQLNVPNIDPIKKRIKRSSYPIYKPEREVWRQLGDRIGGQREIFLLDPDGYLIMIEEKIGEKPLKDV